MLDKISDYQTRLPKGIKVLKNCLEFETMWDEMVEVLMMSKKFRERELRDGLKIFKDKVIRYYNELIHQILCSSQISYSFRSNEQLDSYLEKF